MIIDHINILNINVCYIPLEYYNKAENREVILFSMEVHNISTMNQQWP